MGFQSGIKEEKSLKMLWNNFKVAFAMYSKIPMPMADWNKENMKYTFCFFPFIGAVIGAVSLGAAWLANYLGFNVTFLSVALTVLPVLITGGIHVDGLLDTADALSSWQERKRRLEILKDSNAGAFAVITAGVYFLCWLGAYSEICFETGYDDRCFWIYGIQMFFRTGCDHSSKGQRGWNGCRIFKKIRGRSGTKHSDLLSDHSCSAYDPDRACYGNSGFFCSSRSFCILQIYGNEVFRRNYRGSFRLVSLSL